MAPVIEVHPTLDWILDRAVWLILAGWLYWLTHRVQTKLDLLDHLHRRVNAIQTPPAPTLPEQPPAALDAITDEIPVQPPAPVPGPRGRHAAPDQEVTRHAPER